MHRGRALIDDVLFVGLDAHKPPTVVYGVAEDGRSGEVRQLGVSSRKRQLFRFRRGGDPSQLRCCQIQPRAGATPRS